MSYHYGVDSKLFEIPNPHRIENYFLLTSVVLFVASALAALVHARGDFSRDAYVASERSLAVGVGFLALAIGFAIQAMRQIRFFFGREQPADIVPRLAADATGFRSGGTGQIRDARQLLETIRQNAIGYARPSDPIDVLLYGLVRNLIFSPRKTQSTVRIQFRNILALAFLLVCFVVSQAGVSNAAAASWISLAYFTVTLVVVMRPVRAGTQVGALPVVAVIAFVASSVVGPVIIAKIVPRHMFPFWHAIAFAPITLVSLICALVLCACIFAGGIATMVRPNTISAAPHLETPSLTATPAQIFTELAREMQRLWIEQVPNRTYLRVPPDVTGESGSFDAHLIEETQPLAQDTAVLTFRNAVRDRTTRWLVAADAGALVLLAFGAIELLRWALGSRSADDIVYGASFTTLGAFGFRGAHQLWRRFEFKSKVYWIESHGNFARAAMQVGSYVNDRVRSTREFVNVEGMTLRVWVVEIDSVAFDSDKDRDIVSLRGLPAEAERVCRHLATFAAEQPAVVAPGSSTDLERLRIMQAINRDVAAVPSTRAELAETAASPAIGPVAPEAGGFCTRCGAPFADEHAYCGACGTKR